VKVRLEEEKEAIWREQDEEDPDQEIRALEDDSAFVEVFPLCLSLSLSLSLSRLTLVSLPPSPFSLPLALLSPPLSLSLVYLLSLSSLFNYL